MEEAGAHAVELGRGGLWAAVCLRPQATLRAIIEEDPRRYVNLLIFLPLLVAALSLVVSTTADSDAPKLLAVGALPFAAPVVWVAFHAKVFAAWGLGRILGGSGRFRDVRCAMAWAGLPLLSFVLVSPLLALAVFLGGAAADRATTLLGIALLAAWGWSVVLSVAGIAASHRFSVARAVASEVVAILLLVSLVWRVLR